LWRRVVSFSGGNSKKKATVAVVKLGGRYFQVLMESLIQFLKQVKEHRCSRGQRHPLWFILFIVIVGIMQGYQGYRDLADWAESHQELLASLSSFQPKSIPSYSTIRRAIVGIDCDDFIVQFNEWAAKLLPDTPEMSGLSIDGKSLRSTLTNYRSEKQNFVAIVSAFCHQTNLVLALGKLENRKTSEVPCVRHIIGVMPFQNKTITLDALHCNQKTISAIQDSKNEYLIAVKKNQKNLYTALETAAQNETPNEQYTTCEETSHGRQVTRQVSVFSLPKGLHQDWYKSRCFLQIKRTGWRGQKAYQQTAYYLSSYKEKAKVFAERIRGHWSIENQLHWVKDVIFDEDTSPQRQIQPAVNFSILRTIAIDLFRVLGFISIKEGRKWFWKRYELLPILLE
jgi:predicted transposase YbfD/YdcC